jgi:uncharacterized protein (DUF2062 family)
MPKRMLRNFFPNPEKVLCNPHLKILHPIMSKPFLWHLNRHSVSRAFAVGMFCAFLPIPFQVVIAALIAFYVNANLPISISLVWITNPLTMGPIFYSTYLLGSYILNIPTREIDVTLSLTWFFSELMLIWKPLLIGSLLTATIASLLSYIIISVFWRVQILKHWRTRKSTVLSHKKD